MCLIPGFTATIRAVRTTIPSAELLVQYSRLTVSPWALSEETMTAPLDGVVSPIRVTTERKVSVMTSITVSTSKGAEALVTARLPAPIVVSLLVTDTRALLVWVEPLDAVLAALRTNILSPGLRSPAAKLAVA
jgi:hypothetical protein